MIIQNDNGDVFEELIEVEENRASTFKPLTHSLIVVRFEGAHLLVFNKFHKYWELPGGMIDKSELPRTCALRELLEESNQIVTDPQFIGVMKFDLMPDYWVKAQRIEYGTLFFAELTTKQDFILNDEMSDICFWNGIDNIGFIEPIDAKMIELAEKK